MTLNRSSGFAIDALHLPVENVVADLPRNEFFVAGSIVALEVDSRHPVMAGMPERANIFVDRAPVFTVTEGFDGVALAKYPAAGSPLVSGYLLGAERANGFAAALEAKHGQGRVLLLGMRPQWRGQPFGNFRILMNAVLYARSVAEVGAPTPDFWEAPAVD